MDTMANQTLSDHYSVPEGPTKEDAGLSAAFWQERCRADLPMNWTLSLRHAICVASTTQGLTVAQFLAPMQESTSVSFGPWLLCLA